MQGCVILIIRRSRVETENLVLTFLSNIRKRAPAPALVDYYSTEQCEVMLIEDPLFYMQLGLSSCPIATPKQVRNFAYKAKPSNIGLFSAISS